MKWLKSQIKSVKTNIYINIQTKVHHILKLPRLFEKYTPTRQMNPEMVNDNRMLLLNKALSASAICVPDK